MKEESEFGKGLTYCLALFLCHSMQDDYFKEGNEYRISTWFSGAGDHLYDLVIPEDYPIRLKNRLTKLQDKVLTWRLSMGKNAATKDNAKWAIQEAKDLIRLIDSRNGIETIKGSWE